LRRFSARQLDNYLQQHQPQLIDVREPWEFEICHIPGSLLLPMGQVPKSVERFRQRETVVLCHHGIRSLQVVRFLNHYGIDTCINLDGGLDAWAREVDLDMPTY
jgi:rhodanese-related sulfurtransferase